MTDTNVIIRQTDPVEVGPFITAKQVSEIWDIGRTTLSRLASEGYIRTRKIGDSAQAPIRYRTEDLLDYFSKEQTNKC